MHSGGHVAAARHARWGVIANEQSGSAAAAHSSHAHMEVRYQPYGLQAASRCPCYVLHTCGAAAS